MSGTRDPEFERRDLLLSASLDDEVGLEESEELESLRAQAEPDTAERERAFREVDEGLRALAAEPLDDARLSGSLATLDARLRDREARGTLDDTSVFGSGARRMAVGLAAAAAVVFYLILPSIEPPIEETGSVVDRRGGDAAMDDYAFEAGDEAARVESADAVEDLVLAIGYGEENGELGVIMGDDFEVIEQLELLDYLLALEREERG